MDSCSTCSDTLQCDVLVVRELTQIEVMKFAPEMHGRVESLVHRGVHHTVLGTVQADMNRAVDDLRHLNLDLAVGGHVEADVHGDVVRVGHLDCDVGALGDVVSDVDRVALGRVLYHLNHLILGLIQAVTKQTYVLQIILKLARTYLHTYARPFNLAD